MEERKNHKFIYYLICVLSTSLVFQNSYGQLVVEKQTLTAFDKKINDGYGSAISLFGKMAVIGSLGQDYDVNGNNKKNDAGAAYIYSLKSDSTFGLKQKIVASDREPGDFFGDAVGLFGNKMIVSSRTSDLDEFQGNYKLDAGAAYFFTENSLGNWVEKQKLVASDRNERDRFGRSLDIYYSTYATVAISANRHGFDTNGVFLRSAGAVYIFKENGAGLFDEKQKLTASDRDSTDSFGNGVYLQNESNVLIGAPAHDLDQSGANFFYNAGAVYFFKKNSLGNWIEKQKMVPSDRDSVDYFGERITGSGNFIAISSNDGHDQNGQNYILNSGAVYLFKKNSSGIWIQHQKLVAPYRSPSMGFGLSLSMYGDILIVGAEYASTDQNNQDSILRAGAAFVYIKDSTDVWSFSQKLVHKQRDAGDNFGHDVVIDGYNLLVSAINDEVDNVKNPGTCTYYTIPSTIVGNIELEEMAQSIEYSVYPNPSKGQIIIEAHGGNINEIKMFDLSGKIVYLKNNLDQDFIEFVIPESLNSGLYILQLVSNKSVINKKIMVNRNY